jgi:hypothetical protein
VSDGWEAPDELRELEAVRWYRNSSPFGSSALDSAVSALDSAFDHSVRVAAVAPIDPIGARPVALFIAVDGDVSDDESWQRLVEAHLRYWPPGANLVSDASRTDAYERLHLVLAPVPDARPLGEATTEWFRR